MSEDYSWLEERAAESDSEMTSYNAAKDVLLRPRWEGYYKFQMLLPSESRQWMTPIGRHWNVIPDGEGGPIPIWCPLILFGKDCPICNAINYQISTRRMKVDAFRGDKDGKGKTIADRRSWNYILFLDFEPLKGEKAPDFGEFPSIRIFEFPSTMVKKINGWVQNKDIGARRVADFDKSQVIKMTKDKRIQFTYDADLIGDPSPIPEEFRDRSLWPELLERIPQISSEEVMGLLEQHQRDLPQWLIDGALAIEAGATQKTLPRGSSIKTEKGK